MVDPVLVNATGLFNSRAPTPRLQPSFASVWMHRMDAACPPPIIITPHATIDLQWIEGAFRIAGPDRGPQTEILPAGEVV